MICYNYPIKMGLIVMPYKKWRVQTAELIRKFPFVPQSWKCCSSFLSDSHNKTFLNSFLMLH